jgi:hypothetical protein
VYGFLLFSVALFVNVVQDDVTNLFEMAKQVRHTNNRENATRVPRGRERRRSAPVPTASPPARVRPLILRCLSPSLFVSPASHGCVCDSVHHAVHGRQLAAAVGLQVD